MLDCGFMQHAFHQVTLPTSAAVVGTTWHATSRPRGGLLAGVVATLEGGWVWAP